MKKVAEIVSVKGNIVDVKVERSTMCDGCAAKEKNGKCSCSHASLLGESRAFVSEAVCNIPVKVGDTVIIETADSRVLWNALVVFILPIIIFIAAHALTLKLTSSEGLSLTLGAIAFVLSFTVIGVAEKSKRKKLPDITVIDVVSK
ncbi:MAG: SoxR reducing system RseC family protein [Clostridia bacterium]|nr:SoxR reducing system RseC family protein [Clostridia bacterium]